MCIDEVRDDIRRTAWKICKCGRLLRVFMSVVGCKHRRCMILTAAHKVATRASMRKTSTLKCLVNQVAIGVMVNDDRHYASQDLGDPKQPAAIGYRLEVEGNAPLMKRAKRVLIRLAATKL